MFFEKEMLSFNILDVLQLKQNKVSAVNSGRNFSALSFRFKSNTVLETNNATFKVGDNYLSFVPARLDYKRVSSVDELIVIHFDTADYSSRSIECFLPKNAEVFSQLFKEILEVWQAKELGYKLKCSAIFYNILAECYKQNFTPKQQNSKIQNSVDYLLENFKKCDLSIKEVADKSFMSEVYFRRLFKKEFGVSPQKYLITLRIQHALGLISSGYYSLKEVAFMCGYNDYKYFSVEFKKAMGISPSKYIYNYN